MSLKNKFSYRKRVLILLFFLLFITYLDRICISLLGVRIKSAFHLSNGQFGWVLGAFALAYACFEIPSGILGDRIGQRAVFIRIVLWWSLFTALTGCVTGLYTLIISRFLFGMGESGAFPNSSGTIARWFPVSETGRSMSSIFVGLNAGAAVAPLIVIPIAVAYGWRVPFFVIGLIGIIWVIICWKWFHNEPSEMEGITSGEIQLIEQNRRTIRHSQSFSWKMALKSRNLWVLQIAFFCSQWALYFFVAWMPVYLQQGRHFSEKNMKMITSYLFIIGIAGALIAGVLSDKIVKKKGLLFGRRSVGIIALGITGFCFLVTATTSNNMIAVISLVIGDLFFSFFGITAFSTCVDIGGERAGTVAGIMNFAGQIGAFFLAIVFGKIADFAHNYNTPMFVIAGVLFTGAFIWLAVDPTKQISIEIQNIEPGIGTAGLILVK
jgi:MFS transporter, ACS family, glucarate transporter